MHCVHQDSDPEKSVGPSTEMLLDFDCTAFTEETFYTSVRKFLAGKHHVYSELMADLEKVACKQGLTLIKMLEAGLHLPGLFKDGQSADRLLISCCRALALTLILMCLDISIRPKETRSALVAHCLVVRMVIPQRRATRSQRNLIFRG